MCFFATQTRHKAESSYKKCPLHFLRTCGGQRTSTTRKYHFCMLGLVTKTQKTDTIGWAAVKSSIPWTLTDLTQIFQIFTNFAQIKTCFFSYFLWVIRDKLFPKHKTNEIQLWQDLHEIIPGHYSPWVIVGCRCHRRSEPSPVFQTGQSFMWKTFMMFVIEKYVLGM